VSFAACSDGLIDQLRITVGGLPGIVVVLRYSSAPCLYGLNVIETPNQARKANGYFRKNCVRFER